MFLEVVAQLVCKQPNITPKVMQFAIINEMFDIFYMGPLLMPPLKNSQWTQPIMINKQFPMKTWFDDFKFWVVPIHHLDYLWGRGHVIGKTREALCFIFCVGARVNYSRLSPKYVVIGTTNYDILVGNKSSTL